MEPIEATLPGSAGSIYYRPGNQGTTTKLIEFVWHCYPEARMKASLFIYLVWRRALELQGVDPRTVTIDQLGEMVADSRVPSPVGVWTVRNEMLSRARAEAQRTASHRALDSGVLPAVPRDSWPRYGRKA